MSSQDNSRDPAGRSAGILLRRPLSQHSAHEWTAVRVPGPSSRQPRLHRTVPQGKSWHAARASGGRPRAAVLEMAKMVVGKQGTPPSDPISPRCEVVLARLWTLIDGECPVAICERLLRHLDDCPGCRDRFRLEARIKLLIATRCGGDKFPHRLRRWRPE